MSIDQKTCLVVGAGMAGLTAARTLQQNGWRVTVLDKGRGVGGRLATRRLDNAKADHGAQYFSAKTPEFQQVVRELQTAGIIKEYHLANDNHPRYVGAEGMSAVAKFLAKDLQIHTNERVLQLAGNENQVSATTETGKVFSVQKIIITAPVPQTLDIFKNSNVGLNSSELAIFNAIDYAPCLAVMAVLNQPTNWPTPGGLRLENNLASWICDNQQKGISPQKPCVTIHGSPKFSRQSLETDLNVAAAQLLEAVREWLPAEHIESQQIHRWRYSLAEKRHAEPFITLQKPFTVLVGGDGFGAGNVEGAFVSGLSMAKNLG